MRIENGQKYKSKQSKLQNLEHTKKSFIKVLFQSNQNCNCTILFLFPAEDVQFMVHCADKNNILLMLHDNIFS